MQEVTHNDIMRALEDVVNNLQNDILQSYSQLDLKKAITGDEYIPLAFHFPVFQAA